MDGRRRLTKGGALFRPRPGEDYESCQAYCLRPAGFGQFAAAGVTAGRAHKVHQQGVYPSKKGSCTEDDVDGELRQWLTGQTEAGSLSEKRGEGYSEGGQAAGSVCLPVEFEQRVREWDSSEVKRTIEEASRGEKRPPSVR
jgi:hypothetical protein